MCEQCEARIRAFQASFLAITNPLLSVLRVSVWEHTNPRVSVCVGLFTLLNFSQKTSVADLSAGIMEDLTGALISL